MRGGFCEGDAKSRRFWYPAGEAGNPGRDLEVESTEPREGEIKAQDLPEREGGMAEQDRERHPRLQRAERRDGGAVVAFSVITSVSLISRAARGCRRLPVWPAANVVGVEML